MIGLLNRLQDILDQFRRIDFLAPLLLRFYLAPIFWMAGSNKVFGGSTPDAIGNWYTELMHRISAGEGDVVWFPAMQNTVAWFGNPDWGLGLPAPELMAWLAALTEMGGAVLLVTGLAIRWIAIPLMVTMAVAALAVHWDHGWLAIAEGQGLFANERTMEAVVRLERAKAILREHGNYSWLTARGSFAILNNGIEFAVTYFIMCLTLFFIGAGRFFSIDYWLGKRYRSA